jgi:hypothetical protein
LIKDIVISEFEVHSRGVTDLLAISRTSIGSKSLERIFFLVSSDSDKRGAHAHKSCTQWFALLNGSATLFVADGFSTQILDIGTIGSVIKIPPGIWVEVNVMQPSTIAVLTDQDYDEADYIREWDAYIVQRGTQ